MRELESSLNLEKLNTAKQYLVPHIFSENYFTILKKRIEHKALSSNEQYYYYHFIKAKLRAMMELFDITEKIQVSGKEQIITERLKKARSLIKKYSRKHKNLKLIITGSFLYNEKYNDIDIFILSKYDKEDYRDGVVHVNYLPADIENTLFFKSIALVSVANFKSDKVNLTEKFNLDILLQSYEMITLLIMQNNDYLSELRDLILKAEYMSNEVILSSTQLKGMTDKISKCKNPLMVLSKYIIVKIINSYNPREVKKVLHKFIEKNTVPEKGHEIYPNWKIYNTTYREALEVVA